MGSQCFWISDLGWIGFVHGTASSIIFECNGKIFRYLNGAAPVVLWDTSVFGLANVGWAGLDRILYMGQSSGIEHHFPVQ